MYIDPCSCNDTSNQNNIVTIPAGDLSDREMALPAKAPQESVYYEIDIHHRLDPRDVIKDVTYELGEDNLKLDQLEILGRSFRFMLTGGTLTNKDILSFKITTKNGEVREINVTLLIAPVGIATDPNGLKFTLGDKGDAATIKIGTTTTGEPDSQAVVTNSGDEHNAIFNFTIPKGEKGDKGDSYVNDGTAELNVHHIEASFSDIPEVRTNSIVMGEGQSTQQFPYGDFYILNAKSGYFLFTNQLDSRFIKTNNIVLQDTNNVIDAFPGWDGKGLIPPSIFVGLALQLKSIKMLVDPITKKPLDTLRDGCLAFDYDKKSIAIFLNKRWETFPNSQPQPIIYTGMINTGDISLVSNQSGSITIPIKKGTLSWAFATDGTEGNSLKWDEDNACFMLPTIPDGYRRLVEYSCKVTFNPDPVSTQDSVTAGDVFKITFQEIDDDDAIYAKLFPCSYTSPDGVIGAIHPNVPIMANCMSGFSIKDHNGNLQTTNKLSPVLYWENQQSKHQGIISIYNVQVRLKLIDIFIQD